MAKNKNYSNTRRRPRGNNNSQDGVRQNNKPRNNDNQSRGGGSRNTAQSFLPEPSVLQEYEYATEGAAKRILDMAELEQERRNAWEDEYLRFHKKSLRIGQFLGFLLLVAVVYATMALSESGHDQVAQVLAGSAFLSVALASIFSSRGKNKYPRKPRR